MCAEYKWALEYVLWVLPIVQAFALYAAICARYEVAPKGPTYAEQEIIAEYFRIRKRKKRRTKNR